MIENTLSALPGAVSLGERSIGFADVWPSQGANEKSPFLAEERPCRELTACGALPTLQLIQVDGDLTKGGSSVERPPTAPVRDRGDRAAGDSVSASTQQQPSRSLNDYLDGLLDTFPAKLHADQVPPDYDHGVRPAPPVQIHEVGRGLRSRLTKPPMGSNSGFAGRTRDSHHEQNKFHDHTQKHPHDHHHNDAGHYRHTKPDPPLLYRHEVSDGFFNSVMGWMESIPENERGALAHGRYKIEVVKDVAAYDKEHHTSYANQKPEGYDNGWSGKNVDCFFDSTNNTVVVCEYYVPKGWPVRAKTNDFLDMAARMRHETGHAYDQLLRFRMENDPQLQKIYDDDVKKLSHSPVTRNALRYYLQPEETDAHGQVTDRPGLRETIAELYAILHGGGGDADWKDRSLESGFHDMLDYMSRHGY